METEAFLAKLTSLARPQTVLTSDDQRFVFKFCEVSKQFLKDKASQNVRAGEHRPILYHYGSDGTLILTQQRYTAEHRGLSVHRQGGLAEEFLVERAFVNVFGVHWDVQVSYLGRDPRPLSSGKSTWHIFGACVQFFPMLEKIRAAPGITIYHFCFDRALMSSMKWKLMQRHALFQAAVASGEVPIANPGMSAYIPQLSWLVVQGCALHDAHNSLKWALKAALGDVTKTLKSLHIVIESVRNSFSLLQVRMPLFLTECLRLDDGSDYDAQTLYHEWVNLGCDSHIAELIAHLHLRWEPSRQKLWVAAKHSEDLGLVEKVSFVLMSVMKFRRFTESRWLTLGESSRTLLCALLLGLDGLVELTRKDPAASDYHLHGFTECTEQVRLYCCVAAFVSRVPECLLGELLEDDALGSKGPDLQQLVEDEVHCLTVLPQEVWARAASILEDVNQHDLRNKVLHSGYVALGMLQEQVFSPLASYPWCLCHGNVDEKLDQLADADTPTPSCQVTANIQDLLRGGYNRLLIKKGLELLGQVPWSTNVQEQGHASASTIHRAHRQYGPNVLTSRAQLHMTRPLFVDCTRQRAAKLRGQAERLRRRLSKRLTGRHVFLADFMAANQTVHPRWSSNPEFSRSVMAQHGRVWRLLGPQTQQEYEVRASASEDLRQDLLQAKLGDIEELVEKSARLDQSKEQSQQASFKLSCCTWSLEEVQELLACFNLEEWSRSKVQSLRAAALAPPEPPSEQVQAQLLEATVVPEERQPAPPGWMKQVAQQRQDFAGAVFSLVSEDSATYWLYLYAKQSPYRLFFLELLLDEGVTADHREASYASVLKACAAEPRWSFQRASTKVSMDFELPPVAAEQVFVLPQVAFHPQTSDSFVSWATFVPLAGVLREPAVHNPQTSPRVQSPPWSKAHSRPAPGTAVEAPPARGIHTERTTEHSPAKLLCLQYPCQNFCGRRAARRCRPGYCVRGAGARPGEVAHRGPP